MDIAVPKPQIVHIPSLREILDAYIRFMASSWDNKGLEDFSKADIDYLVDTIKARIGRVSAYTFAHDHFLDDLPAALVTDVTLGTKAAADGTLDAADMVFVAVPAGAAVDMVNFYKDTGTPSTSRRFLYVEFTGVTPNGGDITLVPQATTPFIGKI